MKASSIKIANKTVVLYEGGVVSMKDVEITIKTKMNERWVNDFLSMLKYMEYCGNVGHSAVVGFYSDGDGDFRPKFEFNREYEPRHGYFERELVKQNPGNHLPYLEVIFDAG